MQELEAEGLRAPSGPGLGTVAALVGLLAGAEFISHFNYLLFHSLVEGLAVCLGVGLFLLAWDLRALARYTVLTSLGITYLVSGTIDGLHLLAYTGDGVFGGGANLAIQLWLAARIVEVVGLFLTATSLTRRVRAEWALAVGVLGGSGLLLSIGLGVFPTTFQVGLGLTPFKIGTELVLCGVLAVSAVMFMRDDAGLGQRARRLLVAAILVTICSELVFTLYADPVGPWNRLGHHLKLVSVFLVYLAVLQHGVARPFSALFRAIEVGRRDLAGQVASRTAELTLLTEQLRAEVEERTRAEAAVGRSNQSLQQILSLLPMSVAVHRAGLFVYVNPAVTAVLGYADGELLGKPILDVVHPSDRPQVLERVRQMAKTGQPLPTIEERFIKKDGSVLLVEVSSMPLEFEGEPAALVVARDITEERMLRVRRMDMDRVITMGTLAAGVGHEINNPLSFLMANLSWAQAELAGSADPALLEALADAEDGATRIRDTVAELKRVSQPPADTLACTALEPILRSAISIAANELRHRARLVLELDAQGEVEARAGRLGQVFLNLLINAAQAIERADRADHEIRVHTWDQGGLVIAEVLDTGVGLPAGDPERVFEPFYTTRPAGQGTGLGLSICREIVTRHGGSLRAMARPEGGACFRVELPQAGASEAREVPEQGVPGEEHGRPRLLVIDDDPMVGRSVKRYLRRHADVDVETDAASALALLERDPGYSLILCDLMMPKMTGMAFFTALGDRDPGLAERVMFITGGAFTPEAVAFVEAHAERCLDKPFDERRLMAAIQG